MDHDRLAPTPTIIGELMECHGIAHGISQMPQVTSRPGSSYMGLGPGNPLSNMTLPGLVPAAGPDSSLIQNAKPVKLEAFTPEYSLPSKEEYRYWIRTKIWWLFLRQARNREANWYFWRHISVKRNLGTNLATCLLFVDFSDRIVRHDGSSVNVRGLNTPCESFKIQIRLSDHQHVRFLFADYCEVRKQKLSWWQNILTTFKWVMSYES